MSSLDRFLREALDTKPHCDEPIEPVVPPLEAPAQKKTVDVPAPSDKTPEGLPYTPAQQEKIVDLKKKIAVLKKKVAPRLFFGIPEQPKVAFVIDMSDSVAKPEPTTGKPYVDLAISQLTTAIQSLSPEQQFTIIVFGAADRTFNLNYMAGGFAGAKKARKFLLEKKAIAQKQSWGKYMGYERLGDTFKVIGKPSVIFLLSDGGVVSPNNTPEQVHDALVFSATRRIPIMVKRMGKPYVACMRDDAYLRSLNLDPAKIAAFEAKPEIARILKRLKINCLPYGHNLLVQLAKLSRGKVLDMKFANPPSQKQVADLLNAKKELDLILNPKSTDEND